MRVPVGRSFQNDNKCTVGECVPKLLKGLFCESRVKGLESVRQGIRRGREVMNRVHLIDCMEFMRALPDKHYDLAIVDPPYGIGVDGEIVLSKEASKRGNGTMATVMREKYKSKSWDSATPTPEYFQELFRISTNVIIWGGNYFDLPPTKGVICWDKKQPFGIFSAWEMAWTSFSSPAKMFRFDNKGFMNNEGSNIHPTQKPVALYKWLLQNYAKPGQTIFDSHVGSGSIRIACHDLGFDFEGCEIDEDYWEAQEKRYKTHIAQGRLFEPEDIRPQPVQAELSMEAK